AQVILREPNVTAITDAVGRYLFRNLAAGSYTISVRNEAQTLSHTVRLSAQPVDLINVDFQLSKPGAADVPAPAVSLLTPQATAQEHNMRGRELTKAGRYREAVAELTEAIRMAPDLATAFNARGFALVMLHNWVRAIADRSEEH